jgi:hypothetical protein
VIAIIPFTPKRLNSFKQSTAKCVTGDEMRAIIGILSVKTLLAKRKILFFVE